MEFKIPNESEESVNLSNSDNLPYDKHFIANKKDRYERQAKLAQMQNTFIPITESSSGNSSNTSFIIQEDESRSMTPTKKIPSRKNTIKPVSPFFHMSDVGTYTPPLHLLEQQPTIRQNSQKRSISAPSLLKHDSQDVGKDEDLQFNLELGGGGRKSLFKKRTKRRRKKGGKSTKRRWSRKYKLSINCKKPKGFSQKQYCKGRITRKRKLNLRRRTKRRKRPTRKSRKRRRTNKRRRR